MIASAAQKKSSGAPAPSALSATAAGAAIKSQWIDGLIAGSSPGSRPRPRAADLDVDRGVLRGERDVQALVDAILARDLVAKAESTRDDRLHVGDLSRGPRWAEHQNEQHRYHASGARCSPLTRAPPQKARAQAAA